MHSKGRHCAIVATPKDRRVSSATTQINLSILFIGSVIANAEKISRYFLNRLLIPLSSTSRPTEEPDGAGDAEPEQPR